MAGVGGQFLSLGLRPTNAPSFTNHALDATNDGIGWAMQAESADAITHVGFRYGARTGTPPTYVATLESLNGSTGKPDGTDVGGGSPTAATFTPPADATWDSTWRWVQLTNAYTPSRGQVLCPTVRYSSGTVDGSNFSSITRLVGNVLTATFGGFPSVFTLAGGTWSNSQVCHAVALRTASSRYGFILPAFYNTRSASTVGHRQALKFTLPAGAAGTFKVRGIRVHGSSAAAAGKAPVFGIWSASAAIQTVPLDVDVVQNVTQPYIPMDLMFDEASLTALSFGTTYYAGMEVADAANAGVIINGIQLAEAADLAAFAGGSDFHFATYNGSAWSDDQTVRPFVELILDDLSPPARARTLIGI